MTPNACQPAKKTRSRKAPVNLSMAVEFALEYGAGSEDILATTLAALEHGLQARHIASFPLASCHATDDVAVVLGASAWATFDVLGVEDHGRIVGILDRAGGIRQGPVQGAMKLLNGNMLVAAEAPLEGVLNALTGRRFLLVVRGNGIEGIITLSDLLKLPVRLLLFAHVTHLEMEMLSAIRRTFSDDGWIAHLTQSRQKKLRNKEHQLAALHQQPSGLAELTEFCDKREVVAKAFNLGDGFESDLREIEAYLRNPLAHAATFFSDKMSLTRVVELVGRATYWTAIVRWRGRKAGHASSRTSHVPIVERKHAQEAD
ncbi:MAG: hypothetical protein M0000_09980 [Actinomycetota bacterium]|nr:hypothetical protein [Actinomycetota bacterium]